MYSTPEDNTFLKPVNARECISVLSLYFYAYWLLKLRQSAGGCSDNVIPQLISLHYSWYFDNCFDVHLEV